MKNSENIQALKNKLNQIDREKFVDATIGFMEWLADKWLGILVVLVVIFGLSALSFVTYTAFDNISKYKEAISECGKSCSCYMDKAAQVENYDIMRDIKVSYDIACFNKTTEVSR